jgi:predicted ribosome quality control (RQC) complex YloA/Tae2 family protein
MFETALEKEKRLYEEARSLKFKAREMRKIRMEKEKSLAELRKVAEDLRARNDAEKLKAAKLELDRRIKKVLLNFAQDMKDNGLAIKGPDLYGDKMDAFTIIDQSVWHPASDRSAYALKHPEVKLRFVGGRGFEWDD